MASYLEIQPFIYGIKPAIIAIILGAVFPLAQKSLKSLQLGIIGIAVLILSFLGIEIYLMFGAGLLVLILNYSSSKTLSLLPLPVLVPVSGLSIFLIFLKIGSILYGSGYVLFAFLTANYVNRHTDTATIN